MLLKSLRGPVTLFGGLLAGRHRSRTCNVENLTHARVEESPGARWQAVVPKTLLSASVSSFAGASRGRANHMT